MFVLSWWEREDSWHHPIQFHDMGRTESNVGWRILPHGWSTEPGEWTVEPKTDGFRSGLSSSIIELSCSVQSRFHC